MMNNNYLDKYRIMKNHLTDTKDSLLRKGICLLGLLYITFGCSNQGPIEVEQVSESTVEKNYITVSFGIDTPAFGLPIVTRGVYDASSWSETERSITSYTAWVFEYDEASSKYALAYSLRDDTLIDHLEAIKLRPVEGVVNQWTILALMRETTKATKVVLTANLRDQLPVLPVQGDDYTSVMHDTFIYTVNTGTMLTSIPLIGVTEFADGIAYGVKQTGIRIDRMVSKVTIDAHEAENFQISAIKIVAVNQIARGDDNTSEAAADSGPEQISSSTWIPVTDNMFEAYIAPTSNASDSYILLKATYKNIMYYYKLRFIKMYEEIPVSQLNRNTVYAFLITFVNATGFNSEQEAIEADIASNQVTGQMQTFVVEQKDIMDVTTDNYFFLGLTQGSLSMSENTNYFYTRFSVIANDAWSTIAEELDALPGVTLSRTSASVNECVNGDSTYNTLSIWVWLDKTIYAQNMSVYAGNSFIIKIYTGQTQKKIIFNFTPTSP